LPDVIGSAERPWQPRRGQSFGVRRLDGLNERCALLPG